MHWKAAAKPNETWLSGQGVFQQSARWFIDEKALLLHHICNLEVDHATDCAAQGRDVSEYAE